jgi:vacuolar protein sorting-associated protein 45
LTQAVCILRPTSENISYLRRQLRDLKFGEYHIFFTNIVRDSFLQELADADEKEAVKQVQEYYADFVTVDQAHFTIDAPESSIGMIPPSWNVRNSQRVVDRSIEALAAVLLTLKRRPQIRYQVRLGLQKENLLCVLS